jgi:ribosomal-protein-alanine N-acetyltransferase
MKAADAAAVAAIDDATRMDEKQVRDELERPWARLWVAREDAAREFEGTPVPEQRAGAAVRPTRSEDAGAVVAFLVSWHVADELHVLNVATRADRRRRGIGRALMDQVVTYAREHRVRHVLLEVRRSNAPAIALYRTVGFFAMGVRARYYPDDEDAVEMVLMLDPATGAVVAHADEVRLEG